MNREQISLEESAGGLRVVQITDTHLNRTEGGTLLGLDTDFSLQHVLDLVLSREPRIDLVLGTGDISDHGSEAAYQRAVGYFDQLDAPVLWLPGNHDRAETMEDSLGRGGHLMRSARSQNWLILMLNSQIPGEVGGRLGDGELALLRDGLAEAGRDNLHCLVCLHHQPVPMGSAWIDQQMVEDREAFWQLLESHDCVRGVLWGHVHQQLDDRRGDIALMSTPSTCIQFAPNSDDFKVDDAAPGYRWLELRQDGSIETGVERVTGVHFEVDLDSDGYL